MIKEEKNNIILNSQNEEFDIKIVFQCLIRRKYFIILIAFLSTTYNLIVALTTIRTYQGEFQIALKGADSNSQLASLLPFLGSNFKLKELNLNSGYALKTQVKVLQSPSVLMDIFKFVEKKKKNEINDNYFLKYRIWKKEQLKIGLEENTSILNIAYKDSNREIILPVLKKISKKYREFNGEAENKRLFNTQNFLKNQIKVYEKKNLKSINKIQDFSSLHDLSPIVPSEDSETSFFTVNEASRMELSNQLRGLKEKINLVNNSKDDAEKVTNIAVLDKDFSSGNKSTRKLEELENNLLSLRIIYKPNDPLVIKKQKVKELLNENIKNDYENYLLTKDIDLTSRIKALERPKEVLSEYKQLLEEAARNSKALISLESQLVNVSFSKEKGFEPYELVTEPVLLPYPVGPQRKKMVIFGLIYGLIGGSLASLIYERYKNLVYSVEQIAGLTGIPLIGELDNKDLSLWDSYLKVILKKQNFSEEKNVSLYFSGKVEPKIVSTIESSFKRQFPDFNLKSTFNYKEALTNSNIILFFPLGISKMENIKCILNGISMFKIKTNGFIVIK